MCTACHSCCLVWLSYLYFCNHRLRGDIISFPFIKDGLVYPLLNELIKEALTLLYQLSVLLLHLMVRFVFYVNSVMDKLDPDTDMLWKPSFQFSNPFSSQWREARIVVMWYHLLKPERSRAAALWTRWRREFCDFLCKPWGKEVSFSRANVRIRLRWFKYQLLKTQKSKMAHEEPREPLSLAFQSLVYP